MQHKLVIFFSVQERFNSFDNARVQRYIVSHADLVLICRYVSVGTHAYRFGDRDLQRIRGCGMHLHKFRTIRPDIQGGDEPGSTVLLLEDVDMGRRGVFCFETLELLADGLKCCRVRPSFLAAASAFESIFLRMRPRVALVFLFAEQTFIALVFKFDAMSPSV